MKHIHGSFRRWSPATRYVWDQAADLPQMLSDGSTLYVPGVGQWNGTSWVYELTDGLGSVRQLSDAQGNIVQSYTYAPFGELLAAQGTRSSALQYTGEQKDVDTGLVYLRARWYDSATGRLLHHARSVPGICRVAADAAPVRLR